VNKKILWIGGILILISAALALLLFCRKGSCPLGVSKVADSSLNALLNQAKDSEAKGNLVEAKAAYQKLVAEFSGSSDVMSWQKKAEEMNMKLLFSPVLTRGSRSYEIKPGDTLIKIAREFKTTTELLMKSNNLADGKIFPGRKIKVWVAPFNILVDKSQNTLILKTQEEIVKTYTVSTGKDNSTPIGTFKITNKLVNPTWFKAGAVVPAQSPENILGTRWLGFDLVGYGIHGTTQPQSLGKQVTQGCVRMSNADVEELYAIVPQGTEVTVVD